MTLTTKTSSELDGTAKAAAPSQTSESKSNQSSRSNPVCLEVGVTLRSLPTEQGDLNQAIREEVKTVIVFDNGAVLRSSKTLPAGQKVILTNARGRDVVCKVASGRNMPSVKGYVEVEFVDAMTDFWQLNQNAQPVIPPQTAPVPMPLEPFKEQGPRSSDATRPTAPAGELTKPANQASGSGPSFEDIPGLISKTPRVPRRDSKLDPAKPAIPATVKADLAHEVSEIATPPSFAAPHSLGSDSARKRSAINSSKETPLATPRTTNRTPDFMSKGLLTSDLPQSSSGTSSGRMGLIIGVAVLVLGAIGTGIYVKQRGFAGVPFLKTAVESEPTAPTPPPARTAPERVQPSQQVQSQTPTVPPPAATEVVEPTASVVPIPAANGSALKTETRSIQAQAKNQVAGKRADTAPPRQPAIPNLKMKSPTSPSQRPANPGEETAPMTEVASAENTNGAPPVGLLSAVSRTSAPPAPVAFPPATPAAPATPPPAKVLTSPKLISSTRPIYPVAARDSKIQGSVVINASIDERGNVAAAKAISGPALLRQAALDSVKQWKYSPASLDGKPTSSEVTINVEFQLR